MPTKKIQFNKDISEACILFANIPIKKLENIKCCNILLKLEFLKTLLLISMHLNRISPQCFRKIHTPTVSNNTVILILLVIIYIIFKCDIMDSHLQT